MSSQQIVDDPPSYLIQEQLQDRSYTQSTHPPVTSATDMSAPTKPPLLQPWLGLRARLFLAPISIPLISLLFVASRLWMSSGDATDSVSSAKTNLLSACDAAEGTASLAASFPHFLAATTNVQLAQSVTSTVHGAARVFDLSMTAIEKILSYIVNSYKSLFMCFMELLVRGALAVLIEAVQLISQAITAAAQGIRTAIQDSVQGVNAILSTAVGGINDVVGVFGQHVNAPHIAVPSLTALENITLPHEIQDGLLKLNATLPTLQQLKQTMDALIETPFEQMRREVNATLGGFQFNHTLLPVPQMQNVTFCDRIDTSALDVLGEELRGAARWALIVLGLVAVVVVVLGVGWEWWRWQREVRGVERTRGVWLAQHPEVSSQDGKGRDVLKTENLMSLLTISRHPLISSVTLSLSQRAGIRTRQAQDRLAWLLCFLTHPAALACLFTGLLGLLSVLLQTLLIHRLSHTYSTSINTSLSHLSSDVINLVNDHTRNASLEFSTSANRLIVQVESELNTHVFRWVDTTTSTMNATLNQFVDGITDSLQSTFGGTPFNAPLQTFVQCILGQKVAGIERALTWIHDNAYVNFSLVPADVLVLGKEQEEEVIRPVREAMLGSAGEEGDGVVGKVVARYLKHLRQEKVMFAILVGVYVAILVVGLLVVLYATIAERRGQEESEDGEHFGGEMTDEKLRSDLQAGPSMPGWWRGIPKPSFTRLRQQSSPPTDSPADPTQHLQNIAARRTSTAHSNRSARTHVAKDSISYPFQIHHSLNTSGPLSRPRQPTPLRQTSSGDRNTVLSVRQDDAVAPVEAEAQRNSWLSFLATHSHDDHSAADGEAAQDRFERLFGCSPVTSPTAIKFEHRASAPAAPSGADAERRFRETLDLRPVQDWFGSKSPIPPTANNRGNSEVELTRSSSVIDGEMNDGGEGSYAFGSTAASQIRPPLSQQQQMQKAVGSPQSISFYAW
ncbi:related to PRM1-Pheromone-regulated multispanning membrane protein [Sporisorium reilianum f. sp. reilianum]|uniref:Plasma membrane fusion protein PRM1 n=1 Tax=Sporisorium reilianum f. sp. reilianum TaxID=72559 RepID=A0A2N8UGM1_9BASI|nr:related to PRM1-Pheromone-regulated multispanning membrane protein [Sporisorium reilianum f. sp. reilianum]